MLISLEDGIVVLSIEDRHEDIKNELFMSASHWLFEGFYRGKLKINSIYKDNSQNRTIYEIEEEQHLIRLIILNADTYRIPIDVAVRKEFAERLDFLESILKVEEERLVRENEKRKQLSLWEDKCKNGCGDCKYRRRGYDDNFCVAGGKRELITEERNVPKYINGVHYMFNYEPFPLENCPFKINKREEITE